MKLQSVGLAVTLLSAMVSAAWAQAPTQPQWPPATYPDPARYRFNAPTPEDAYRDGLINRWEFEQLAGPLPQALQGPPADSSKGSSDGGRAGR